MRNISIQDWATLYGVVLSFRKIRWYEWETRLTSPEGQVRARVFSYVRPSPERAVRELRKLAREAHVCQTFEGWLSRQPIGRTMQYYRDEWATRVRARADLIATVGEEGTYRFLWSTA